MHRPVFFTLACFTVLLKGSFSEVIQMEDLQERDVNFIATSNHIIKINDEDKDIMANITGIANKNFVINEQNLSEIVDLNNNSVIEDHGSPKKTVEENIATEKIMEFKQGQYETMAHNTGVSPMIHSAKPTVSPIANIVFHLKFVLFVKTMITTGRDCGSASWIKN